MAPIKIPYVDIRGGSPVDLLRRDPESARRLAAVARETFGLASRAASAVAFPLGDRASLAWLARTANPYLDEVKALAGIAGVRGAVLLNICFEWGCTSGVWAGGESALLRRVLDWPFPELGERLVVAHQSGEAGDFYNATWPGISGLYQAMAPGRFAAAINQAPSRRHGAGHAGDWALSRVMAGRAAGLPPAHLLRRVFETAPDYRRAKAMLCETEIAVPAIFILSGIAPGEGCVIERTEAAFAVRAMENERVCAANHFDTHLAATGRGWRPRPIDSHGRQAAAMAQDGGAGFAWFAPPIANVNSRLVLNADAARGTFELAGTAGTRRVTEIFTLAA